MNNTIEMILQQYKEGALTLEAATAALQHDEPSVLNLGFANLDLQRQKRCGFPERPEPSHNLQAPLGPSPRQPRLRTA